MSVLSGTDRGDPEQGEDMWEAGESYLFYNFLCQSWPTTPQGLCTDEEAEQGVCLPLAWSNSPF